MTRAGEWSTSSIPTNTITSADGTSRTEQYSYDELNRLKTVDYGDGQTQGYSFDAMGNRTQKTDSVNGSEGYTFNAANMLLTRAGSGYTNDLDGNTLTGGGRTNTWDSQNRLAQCVHGADTSSFVYGADGIRRRSTVNGTTTDFVLDNSIFIRERRAGANIATYLVGARGPEYRRDDSSGAVRWYLYDGLGSVLGEVDPTGTVTSSRKYDVYGLVRGGTNPGGTSKHKFVGALGHPSEDETGLTYMRARYYDPVVGRFASEDPAQDGVNWFSYCGANPICRCDATGKAMSDAAYSFLMDMFFLLITFGAYQFATGYAAFQYGTALMKIAEALLLYGAGFTLTAEAAIAALAPGFAAEGAALMAVGKQRMLLGVGSIVAGAIGRIVLTMIWLDGGDDVASM